jgi:hypothetical protein
MTLQEESDSSVSNASWVICGHPIPKNECIFLLTYLCQVLVVYIVITASIYNLSVGHDQDKVLWTALLSSCLGYILPNPSLKKVTLPSKQESSPWIQKASLSHSLATPQ